ncbi:MAG: hypothetical protein AAF719_09660 [Pseudomonadota bacterium]
MRILPPLVFIEKGFWPFDSVADETLAASTGRFAAFQAIVL